MHKTKHQFAVTIDTTSYWKLLAQWEPNENIAQNKKASCMMQVGDKNPTETNYKQQM